MKHLHTFESFVNEGSVKQFEFDYKNLVKGIKDGLGWIDPEYVEETWENTADFTPYDMVKDEVLTRLMKADLLYEPDPNNPEKKGKKVTKLS
jgi:hypothetical protein